MRRDIGYVRWFETLTPGPYQYGMTSIAGMRTRRCGLRRCIRLAVLVNTAIAIASDPIRMAQAFKKAIEAGREAHEIGLGEKQWTASPTSPLTAFFSSQAQSG